MKKLFAILLATTMLFAAFAMPAFATMDYWTNTPPEGGFENYEEDELTAEGWVKLDIVSGRSIMYGVKITNLQQSRVVYDANIQCVATYDDGAFDADFDSGSVNLLQMAEFNHQVELEKGVLEEECSAMLSQFFRELREKKKRLTSD